MRSNVLRSAAACLALAALPAFAADTGGGTAVDDAWLKAMKANDIEGIVKLYASDAVAWLPDMAEAKGTDAIRAAYKGLMEANTVKDVALTDRGSRKMGKDVAAWGKYRLVLAPKAGGEPMVLTGRFSEVVEERNGKWLYVVDHASAEPAPAKK